MVGGIESIARCRKIVDIITEISTLISHMLHKHNCSLPIFSKTTNTGSMIHVLALDADLCLTLSLYINIAGDPSNRKPFKLAYPSYVFPSNPILKCREGGLLFHLPIVQVFAHFPQAHNDSTKGVVAIPYTVAV